MLLNKTVHQPVGKRGRPSTNRGTNQGNESTNMDGGPQTADGKNGRWTVVGQVFEAGGG